MFRNFVGPACAHGMDCSHTAGPAVGSRCHKELRRALPRLFLPHDFRTGSVRTQGDIISGPDQRVR